MDNVLIKREFKRFNEKLTSLLTERGQTQKITLVKMGIVRELTGLDKEGMRRARDNNLLTQVKNEKGIWYELETIHSSILIKENGNYQTLIGNRKGLVQLHGGL